MHCKGCQMKIIDVTLRDGGFVNDFNWNLSEARRHIEVCNSIGLHYIELAYWKQNAKSNNLFYSMDESILSELTDGLSLDTKLGVMIDYHYCKKEFSEYPKIDESSIDLIRITSRKEDIIDAINFSRELKDFTGLNISFQIFF